MKKLLVSFDREFKEVLKTINMLYGLYIANHMKSLIKRLFLSKLITNSAQDRRKS